MLSFENKKVIIFDLDGTIVNLDVDWHQLKMLLSARYSKLYEEEKYEFDHISACLDHVVEKKDEIELENFFKLIQDYEMKNINNNKVIEETIFFINNLELFSVLKRTKLAIFSLNTRKAIIASLKSANIFEKFDFIVGREDLRKWKPHPLGLFRIKDYFNVNKEEMVYFGDLEKDIKTGNNAGIETHLVNEIIALVNKKRQEMKIN